MKIPGEISCWKAGINQSLSTAELFRSLVAPPSQHQSRHWRNSRLISLTSRSADQVRCPTQHAPSNGLLGNPDYPQETATILKRAVG